MFKAACAYAMNTKKCLLYRQTVQTQMRRLIRVFIACLKETPIYFKM